MLNVTGSSAQNSLCENMDMCGSRSAAPVKSNRVFTRIVYNSNVQYKKVQGLLAKGNKFRALVARRKCNDQKILCKELVTSDTRLFNGTQYSSQDCHPRSDNVVPDSGRGEGLVKSSAPNTNLSACGGGSKNRSPCCVMYKVADRRLRDKVQGVGGCDGMKSNSVVAEENNALSQGLDAPLNSSDNPVENTTGQVGESVGDY